MFGRVRQERADGDPQLVERVGEGGSNAVLIVVASGSNAQSTVAYHRSCLEPKRALIRLWLTPSSRSIVRTGHSLVAMGRERPQRGAEDRLDVAGTALPGAARAVSVLACSWAAS